ncbi:hypothetical protein DFQ28_002807 [Apophysomyces sp. BC1034]|nr:hypothetical protein DFQ29_004792 [Apophysomyces sp. BC1021]KAG0189863.1 hypothetical protein DFQ28_002807 [Apophysomyces sp. BC1034]
MDSTLSERDIDEFARICKVNMMKKNQAYTTVARQVGSLQNTIESQKQTIAGYEKTTQQMTDLIKDSHFRHSHAEESLQNLRERYDAFHCILGSLEKFAYTAQNSEKATRTAFDHLENRIETSVNIQRAQAIVSDQHKADIKVVLQSQHEVAEALDDVRQQITEIQTFKEELHVQNISFQETLETMKQQQQLHKQQLDLWKDELQDVRSAVSNATLSLQNIDEELHVSMKSSEDIKANILSIQMHITELEYKLENKESASEEHITGIQKKVDSLNQQ